MRSDNRQRSRGASFKSEDEGSAYGFGEVLGDPNQATAVETGFNRSSNPMKLSYILETSIFFEIDKQCMKCKETLREEEIFTGF